MNAPIPTLISREQLAKEVESLKSCKILYEAIDLDRREHIKGLEVEIAGLRTRLDALVQRHADSLRDGGDATDYLPREELFEKLGRLHKENEKLKAEAAKRELWVQSQQNAIKLLAEKAYPTARTAPTAPGWAMDRVKALESQRQMDLSTALHNYEATVVNVVDGDTVDADVALGFHLTARLRLRLLGVNCPEMRGPTRQAGIAARMFVFDNLFGKEVIIHTEKADDFGRYLARITLDGVDFNRRLIDEGFAVPFMTRS